jgi:hypothetical protein
MIVWNFGKSREKTGVLRTFFGEVINNLPIGIFDFDG